VILFEMLTGRPPFDDPSPMALLLQQIQVAPPSVNAGARIVPAALEAIVERGLAKAPKARFQSAAEFRGALRDYLRGRAAEPPPQRPFETLSDGDLGAGPFSDIDPRFVRTPRSEELEPFPPTVAVSETVQGGASSQEAMASAPDLELPPTPRARASGSGARTIAIVIVVTAVVVIALGGAALYALRWIWLPRPDGSRATAQGADSTLPFGLDDDASDGRRLDATMGPRVRRDPNQRLGTRPLAELDGRDAFGREPSPGGSDVFVTRRYLADGVVDDGVVADGVVDDPTPRSPGKIGERRDRDVQAPRKIVTPTVARVVLRVSSAPPAELFLGTRRLGLTPRRVAVAKGRRTVKLTLRRKGYKTLTLNVVPDRSRPISATLRPIAPTSTGDGIFKPLGK
ncbi:MAG: hypothetical protein KC609_18430, partial [Myxococcales bacterium]|nr:hypothetical protein [Myxococcales bacterium]